jgi:hypothetical protein
MPLRKPESTNPSTLRWRKAQAKQKAEAEEAAARAAAKKERLNAQKRASAKRRAAKKKAAEQQKEREHQRLIEENQRLTETLNGVMSSSSHSPMLSPEQKAALNFVEKGVATRQSIVESHDKDREVLMAVMAASTPQKKESTDSKSVALSKKKKQLVRSATPGKYMDMSSLKKNLDSDVEEANSVGFPGIGDQLGRAKQRRSNQNNTVAHDNARSRQRGTKKQNPSRLVAGQLGNLCEEESSSDEEEGLDEFLSDEDEDFMKRFDASRVEVDDDDMTSDSEDDF